MKYLLDTDTIIYWLNGDQNIEARVMTVGLGNVSTSIVSKAELFFGAYNSTHIEQNLKNIEQFSKTMTILPFDDPATKLFGKIKSELKNQGQIILDADIMIASIALAHNLTLVTNNTSHFQRVSSLSLENWRNE